MKKIIALCLSFIILLSAFSLPASAETGVEEILAGMSLRAKITQMMMVSFRHWDDGSGRQEFTVMNPQVQSAVTDYNFGAIIYFAQNLASTEQSFELTMAFQQAATADGGIPLIIATDQEGGSVYRLGTGTALPGNMALGAAGDEKYAEMAGEVIGSELNSLGINTVLAPVVDVNSNANNPIIGLRSYGDDPAAVGRLASAEIRGLKEYNVIGCAKHFPGHGDTATDSHYGLPTVNKSKDELLQNELLPFKTAIDEGVEMIMTAHILYPQLESDTLLSNWTGGYESLPATMSDDIVTGILKTELGFDGIVVTDAMNMESITSYWGQTQAIKNAINAGVDMICMPCTLDDAGDFATLDTIIDGIASAVESGEIPTERIDDAVRRILTVKQNRGILDFDAQSYSLENALATVGSDENREKEREISAAAVTVVKNENGVLPLQMTENSKLLMLAPYENETAQLMMGYNRAAEAGLVPVGAELRCQAFGENSAWVTEGLKPHLDWADTVVVISEVYDAWSMEYDSWLSAGANNFVNYAKENGKKAIVMSVDKPYDVQSYPNADAVLAVYGSAASSVDPTEALVGGVTGAQEAFGPNIVAGVEVILGVFAAQGTLPVDIPKFDNSTNSYTQEIAYPRGTGLFYSSLLPEPEPTPEPTPSEVEEASEPSAVSELPAEVQSSAETSEEEGTGISRAVMVYLAVAAVVLLLAIILIVMIASSVRKRRKRRRTTARHTRNYRDW